MDTLLIFRDTITVNALKVIDSCQPCIHEAETNGNDILNVLILCMTVMVVVAIICVASVCWHKETLSSRRLMKDAEYRFEENKRKDEDERVEKEWANDMLKKEYSKEDTFIDYCQKQNGIQEKLTEVCANLYEIVMKRRLNSENN